MAVLSWGSTGPEVERLQQLLQRTGVFFGVVDGRYGPLTYAAVRRFQESAGLVVDGVAGPDTMAALERGASGAGTPDGKESHGDRQARSLHIGINRVDPTRYGGWDGVLSGCENDAETMVNIARVEGFTSRRLFSPQATSDNILGEIRAAAGALGAGDTFLLTYAGHGGQTSDPTGVEEIDAQDETWVAYDRQIIDDELAEAFAEFAPGVRIVVVSDSCHSGTVVRMLPVARGRQSQEEFEDAVHHQQLGIAELKHSYYDNLAVARPAPGEPPFAGFPRPLTRVSSQNGRAPAPSAVLTAVRAEEVVDEQGRPAPIFSPMAFPVGGSRGSGERLVRYATRDMPYWVNREVNQIQRQDLVRAKTRARSRSPVQATGLLLSGCADNQLSQEVGGAGVFTTTLNRIWSNNAFQGPYVDLVQQVVSQMGPTQTPQLTTFGQSADRLAASTPFDTA